jgi:hypothetical protein
MRTGHWARRAFEKMSCRQIDMMFKMIKSGGIDKAQMKTKELSFDWHSKTIKSLVKYQLLTAPLSFLKLGMKK